MENKKERNSSIELLKIIAMFMIVISHLAQSYGTLHTNLPVTQEYFYDLKIASVNINNIIMILLRSLGAIGNDIFFICTAWFLVDSKKSNKKKVIEMLLDVWAINIAFLLILKNGGVNVGKKDEIKAILPNTFALNWYITCYVIFYIIHPYLNKMIERLEKKGLLFLSLFMLFLYSIMNTITGGLFFTSNLIVFVTIYLCVAYIKKYMIKTISNKKIDRTIAILAVIFYILTIILLNALGTRISVLNSKMLHFVKTENPLFLLFAFSLFNLFRSRNFVNKGINNLSKLTLYIYVIQENSLFRTYIRPYIFVFIKDNMGYDLLPLWTILSAVLLFIASAILSWIYKVTLHKLIVKFVNKNYEKVRKLYNRFMDKVMSIE